LPTTDLTGKPVRH